MEEGFEKKRWRDLVEASRGSHIRTKNGRIYRKASVRMASNCMRGELIRREHLRKHEGWHSVRGSQILKRSEIVARAVGRASLNLWGRSKGSKSDHQE